MYVLNDYIFHETIYRLSLSLCILENISSGILPVKL